MSTTAVKGIPEEVLEAALKEKRRIEAKPEWRAFATSWASLDKATASGPIPFDPKFNAMHWAFDVSSLCREIAYGLMWMNAYAAYYMLKVKPGEQPAHVDFQVSYFADNSISRIDSCRDKLALMVWSFYCAFNPEERKEVLIYEDIIRRLKWPVKYGLSLRGQKVFLEALNLLQGEDFVRMGQYRDLKVHRREPRIEIYGVESHHDWPYLVPLTEDREIARWKRSFEEQYKDPWMREHIEPGCRIKGVIFDQRTLKGRLWSFRQIQSDTERCLAKLLEASATCFRVLRGRSPFMRRPRRSLAQSSGAGGWRRDVVSGA